MSSLAERTCVPCKGGIPPLRPDQIDPLLRELGNGWTVVRAVGDTSDGGLRLEKLYRFENFRQALEFVVRIGEVSEQQKHHPDVHLAWGKVTVEIWTHKIDGLTESDFILASKCDRVQE